MGVREDSPEGAAVVVGVAATAAIGTRLVTVEDNKPSTSGVHWAALTVDT